MAAWNAAYEEREEAIRRAGLAECEWMRKMDLASDSGDAASFDRRIASIKKHLETCEVCKARERYESEHFAPMPPMPQTWWMRGFGAIGSLPDWARPAAFGALFLGAIVSLRVLFALPYLVTAPARVAQALLAVVAAAVAGAMGGFAYSLIRPLLRRLGRPGDYLTGVVCVVTYLGSLALVAPVAFGESLVHDRAEAVIFLIVAAFFGLFIGHTWFREKPTLE